LNDDVHFLTRNCCLSNNVFTTAFNTEANTEAV